MDTIGGALDGAKALVTNQEGAWSGAAEGALPFGSPMERAGLYNSNDPGMGFSKAMGATASIAGGGGGTITARVARAGRGMFKAASTIAGRNARYWAGAGRSGASNQGELGRYFSETIARHVFRNGQRTTPTGVHAFRDFLTSIKMVSGKSEVGLNFWTGKLTHFIP